MAHLSHRNHERTAIKNVDTHGDYEPNPKINPYASARNGSILGRGDFSTQDQKDDPSAPRGKNIPNAREKPHLAGGDYV
jgi:hypothetical protein